MDRRTQAAMLLAMGGISLRLGLTDAALAYVKASMQIPLTVAGAVLVTLGVYSLVQALRPDTDDAEHPPGPVVGAHNPAAAVLAMEAEAADSDDHAHGHAPGEGPRVAWLMVLPLLALLLIAPPPLGAFAAGRQSLRPPETADRAYPPLPDPVDGAVELTVAEFVFRGVYDPDASLEGERVRLTGFVTHNEDLEEGEYLLSRFILSCCAADATALNVEILGDGLPREADTWLEVEGTWEPRPGIEPGEPTTLPPLLHVESVTPIEPPTQPYEY